MARVYFCNKCGKKMTMEDKDEGFSIRGGLGYGMDEYDGEYLELDLCCDCMMQLIKECVISPVATFDDGSEGQK